MDLPESTVTIIIEEMKRTDLYFQMLITIQDFINDPQITLYNFEVYLKIDLLKTEYKQKFENLIYQYLFKHPDLRNRVKKIKEPLDHIQKAQINWEKKMCESLNYMCTTLGKALSRKRSISEQKALEAKWTELGTEEGDLNRFHPIYSPRDFLDILLRVRNPNNHQVTFGGDYCGAATEWGHIKVILKVMDVPLLKKVFRELATNIQHLGIDDYTTALGDTINYSQKRVILSQQLLKINRALSARAFVKQGCPKNYRAKLWALILGVKTSDASRLQFEHLKTSVFLHDLIVDRLVFKDVNLTASNDDQFFVFEDLLYQILLVFSRDSQILDHFEYSSANPFKAYLRGREASKKTIVNYPPNGIIPFHGFAMLVCPLCFVYEDPVTLYMVFRELYTRHFYLLHNVSSHPQGILSLCLLFESSLHELDPYLAYHIASKKIQPLNIVVKWLMRAFSGYLSIDQILLLWDRILAYNALEIIAVLAVAIMIFRRSILLQAESQLVFESMLADISNINVIPLLQGILSNNFNSGSN